MKTPPTSPAPAPAPDTDPAALAYELTGGQLWLFAATGETTTCGS